MVFVVDRDRLPVVGQVPHDLGRFEALERRVGGGRPEDGRIVGPVVQARPVQAEGVQFGRRATGTDRMSSSLARPRDFRVSWAEKVSAASNSICSCSAACRKLRTKLAWLTREGTAPSLRLPALGQPTSATRMGLVG